MNSQGTFDRPSAFKTILKSLVWHSKLFGPIGNALRYVVKGHKASTSRVSQLLLSGGPLAVIFRVAKRVVNSLSSMLRRGAWPHVMIEYLKRLPFIADRNTSAAIVVVAVRRDAAATRAHGTPCGVFRGLTHAVRLLPTMCAAPAAPTSERCTGNLRVCSAVTDAVPVAHVVSLVVTNGFVNDGPLTESLAGQIYKPGAVSSRIGLIHQKNLLNRFGRWKSPSGSCNLSLGLCHSITRLDWGQTHAA